MRWGVAALFVLMSIPASAAEPPAELPAHTLVHLDYTTRDPACPDSQFLQDVIAARTSYAPFAPAAVTRLVVTVGREGQGYTARAVLRDKSGAVLYTRERGPLSDCQQVVEGLGFAVSVKLDPGGRPSAPSPQPASPSAPLPVKEEPAPSPPPEPRARRRVGAALAFGLGVAPRPVVGFALDVGLRWPAFSIALEGRVFPSAEGPADTSLVQLRTWQITGAVVPCGHWRWIFGCGLVEMGALSATSDARSPRTGTAFHFATGLRGGVEWQGWEHLALRASGDLLVAPWRTALRVEGGAQFTTPIFSGVFGAGVVASF
jgi:hypothetical protein